MFEKFSISDIDSAGRGGEYTVQAGFGWTNGVVLIVASEFGDVLVLEIDRGRSRSGAASPPFPRRRIECFRDTWRVGCGVDAEDGAFSWSIVRDDRDRLKAESTLNAVGG